MAERTGWQTIAKRNRVPMGFVVAALFLWAARPTPATLLLSLAHGNWMNEPWGVAVAPADFGLFSSAVLVANTGNGLIAAFNIDDLQAGRAKRNGLGLKDALLVRAAMLERRYRTVDTARNRGATCVRKAGNAAQFRSFLLPSLCHFRP